MPDSCNITVTKLLCGVKIINLVFAFLGAVIQYSLNVTTFLFASYGMKILWSLWVETSSIMTIIALFVGWFGVLGENESGLRFRKNKRWRLNRPSFRFPRIVDGQFEFVGNASPSPLLSRLDCEFEFFIYTSRLSIIDNDNEKSNSFHTHHTGEEFKK